MCSRVFRSVVALIDAVPFLKNFRCAPDSLIDLRAGSALLRSHQGHPASAGRRGLLSLPEWGLLYRAGHLHLHRRLDGLRLSNAGLRARRDAVWSGASS